MSDPGRVDRLRACIERFFELEGVADVDVRLVEVNAAVMVLERQEGVSNKGTAKRRVDIHVRAAQLADKAREVV